MTNPADLPDYIGNMFGVTEQGFLEVYSGEYAEPNVTSEAEDEHGTKYTSFIPSYKSLPKLKIGIRKINNAEERSLLVSVRVYRSGTKRPVLTTFSVFTRRGISLTDQALLLIEGAVSNIISTSEEDTIWDD